MKFQSMIYVGKEYFPLAVLTTLYGGELLLNSLSRDDSTCLDRAECLMVIILLTPELMLRKGITLFETVRNYEISIYCYVPSTGKTCSDLRYLDVIPRFQSWTASINSPGKLKINHWPVKQSHFMTGNPYFKGFLDKKSAK